MLTELVARSLRDDELAERLRYHEDPGVHELASRIVGGSTETQTAQLKRELEQANDELQEAERRVGTLKDLLFEVVEDCEIQPALLKRIKAEL